MSRQIFAVLHLLFSMGCSVSSVVEAQKFDDRKVSQLKLIDSLYDKYGGSSYTIADVKWPVEKFSVEGIKIGDSIRIVETKLGDLIRAEKRIGMNGQNYQVFYYDGVSIVVQKEKIFSVTVARTDMSTPDSIRCGLRLNDLRKRLPKADFKENLSGKITISSSPIDYLLLTVLIRDGVVQALCLRSGAD